MIQLKKISLPLIISAAFILLSATAFAQTSLPSNTIINKDSGQKPQSSSMQNNPAVPNLKNPAMVNPNDPTGVNSNTPSSPGIPPSSSTPGTGTSSGSPSSAEPTSGH